MGQTNVISCILLLHCCIHVVKAVAIDTSWTLGNEGSAPDLSEHIQSAKEIFRQPNSLSDSTSQLPADVHVTGNAALDKTIDIKVRTDGRTFNLNLQRLNSHILHKDFKVLSVYTDDSGKTVLHEDTNTNRLHEKARQMHFYHDPDSGTFVSVTQQPSPEGTKHLVEGIIHDEVIVAPHTASKRHKRSLDPSRHTVYKKDLEKHSFLNDELFVPESVLNNLSKYNSSRSPHARFKRQFPTGNSAVTKIEPELLLFCDNAMVTQFEGDTDELLEYLLHFWHAVNWKFLTVSLQRKWPLIDLKIREIGVFRDKSAQPFIEENRIRQGSRLFSLYDAMDSLQRWLVKYESVLPTHDIAFLQTGNDACRMTSHTRRFKDSRFTSEEEEEVVDGCVAGTAGVAYVRGACLSAPYYRKIAYNFGIGEASTSFNGIIIATHEVGHLLGAYHDGEAEASGCASNSGYIMSYSREDSYKFSRFSDCSVRSFQNFLGMSRAGCLKQRGSTEFMQFPTSFPGTYMSIREQCRRFTGGPPCEIGPKQCEHLCCDDAKGQWRYTRSEPAVDGTSCGTGLICLNGQCIALSSFGKK